MTEIPARVQLGGSHSNMSHATAQKKAASLRHLNRRWQEARATQYAPAEASVPAHARPGARPSRTARQRVVVTVLAPSFASQARILTVARASGTDKSGNRRKGIAMVEPRREPETSDACDDWERGSNDRTRYVTDGQSRQFLAAGRHVNASTGSEPFFSDAMALSRAPVSAVKASNARLRFSMSDPDGISARVCLTL